MKEEMKSIRVKYRKMKTSFFDFFEIIIDGTDEEMKKKLKRKTHWFNLLARFEQFHE